jgi:MFS family permease
MAHLFVPESPVRQPGKINWLAAVLLSSWLVCLLIGVSKAPTWGWGSTAVLGLLAVGVVLCGIWIRVEWRAEHPLIDMQMMRQTTVWTNNLVAFLFGVGIYSSGAIIPEFLQTPKAVGYGFGLSITMSSVYLLPQIALMFVFGLWSGGISNRIGSKRTLMIGGASTGLGYVIFTFFNTRPGEILAASALIGVGMGLAFSALAHLIVQAVPKTQTGVASGMNANIRTIGGALGAAVVASIVAATLQASGYPSKIGYTWSFGLMALTTFAGVAVALLVPAPRHDHVDDLRQLVHAEIASVAGATIVD